MASFRLKKVATDFNVGIQTLVDYLAKKGHQVEPSPTTKISDEQYELLATAFQGERKVKEEADKIELVTGGNRVVDVSSKSHSESESEEVIIKNYSSAKAQPEAAVAPEPEPSSSCRRPDLRRPQPVLSPNPIRTRSRSPKN